jgi:hypothetical protein
MSVNHQDASNRHSVAMEALEIGIPRYISNYIEVRGRTVSRELSLRSRRYYTPDVGEVDWRLAVIVLCFEIETQCSQDKSSPGTKVTPPDCQIGLLGSSYHSRLRLKFNHDYKRWWRSPGASQSNFAVVLVLSRNLWMFCAQAATLCALAAMVSPYGLHYGKYARPWGHRLDNSTSKHWSCRE